MITTRPQIASSLASWTMAVAVVIGITFIGQLRSQTSEASGGFPVSGDVVRPAAVGTGLPAATAIADDEEVLPGEQDEVTLVPAIYAWDPDVRFVYFRHVSKWM